MADAGPMDFREFDEEVSAGVEAMASTPIVFAASLVGTINAEVEHAAREQIQQRHLQQQQLERQLQQRRQQHQQEDSLENDVVNGHGSTYRDGQRRGAHLPRASTVMSPTTLSSTRAAASSRYDAGDFQDFASTLRSPASPAATGRSVVARRATHVAGRRTGKPVRSGGRAAAASSRGRGNGFGPGGGRRKAAAAIAGSRGSTPLAVQKHQARMSQDSTFAASSGHGPAVRERASARQHRTDALRRQLEEAEQRELTLKPAITDYFARNPHVASSRGRTAMDRFRNADLARQRHLAEIESEVGRQTAQVCTFQPDTTPSTRSFHRIAATTAAAAPAGHGEQGSGAGKRQRNVQRGRGGREDSGGEEPKSGDGEREAPFWDRLYQSPAPAVEKSPRAPPVRSPKQESSNNSGRAVEAVQTQRVGDRKDAQKSHTNDKPGWRGSGALAPSLRRNPFSPTLLTDEEKKRRKTFYEQLKAHRAKREAAESRSGGTARGASSPVTPQSHASSRSRRRVTRGGGAGRGAWGGGLASRENRRRRRQDRPARGARFAKLEETTRRQQSHHQISSQKMNRELIGRRLHRELSSVFAGERMTRREFEDVMTELGFLVDDFIATRSLKGGHINANNDVETTAPGSLASTFRTGSVVVGGVGGGPSHFNSANYSGLPDDDGLVSRSSDGARPIDLESEDASSIAFELPSPMQRTLPLSDLGQRVWDDLMAVSLPTKQREGRSCDNGSAESEEQVDGGGGGGSGKTQQSADAEVGETSGLAASNTEGDLGSPRAGAAAHEVEGDFLPTDLLLRFLASLMALGPQRYFCEHRDAARRQQLNQDVKLDGQHAEENSNNVGQSESKDVRDSHCDAVHDENEPKPAGTEGEHESRKNRQQRRKRPVRVSCRHMHELFQNRCGVAGCCR